jgi:hypothetical protein
MLARLALAPQGILSGDLFGTRVQQASQGAAFVQGETNGDELGEDACGLRGQSDHSVNSRADSAQFRRGASRMWTTPRTEPHR